MLLEEQILSFKSRSLLKDLGSRGKQIESHKSLHMKNNRNGGGSVCVWRVGGEGAVTHFGGRGQLPIFLKF